MIAVADPGNLSKLLLSLGICLSCYSLVYFSVLFISKSVHELLVFILKMILSLPYFSVIDLTQVALRVSNLNILALIFAHN
jgi:hypothetical protein